jgi:quercetin dioxygenase-like cupin family protein
MRSAAAGKEQTQASLDIVRFRLARADITAPSDGVVIEGEMTLVLDDSEVLLKPGSVVVQRGSNHAWANRSGKPCRMLFMLIDGAYEPTLAAAIAKR